MKDCLFCKIIKGEIPSYKIYENEETLAFLDINPDSYGHTLVIPKKHFKSYEDTTLEAIKTVNQTGKIVFQKIKENLKADGIKIVQNNGIVQDIPHYHIHIIPVYKSDKENKKDFAKVLEALKK